MVARKKQGKSLVGTIKASKDESEYSGSAYDRVNKMIQGKSSGKLTAHIGHGHNIYTFSATDSHPNNFTSLGTKSIYTITKQKSGWKLGRISGDLRDNVLSEPTMQVGGSKKYKSGSLKFKKISDLKSSNMNISDKAISKIKLAMKDYKSRHAGTGRRSTGSRGG